MINEIHKYMQSLSDGNKAGIALILAFVLIILVIWLGDKWERRNDDE